MVARGNRALHDRDALRGLPRLSPEAGGARGEDRRQAYRRDLDAFGQGGDRLGARTAGKTRRQAQRDRAAHPEGDRRPPDLPQRRRPRLSHAVARLGHAVGRREPAHPAGVADRLRPHRRALCARRAFDRAAPARQCAAARHAAAPARTRQHRDRGGARRGRDPRRRLCRRHRPGRRRAWRRDHREGRAGRNQGRPEFAHRRLSLRRALRADPAPAPRGDAGARAAHRRRARQQSEERHRRDPARPVHLRHRRIRRRQVDLDDRYALQGCRARISTAPAIRPRRTITSKGWSSSTR